MASEPVDGNVGELFLKIVVHEVFGFVFGISCAAGEAFFFYVLQEVYPLFFHGVKLK